MLLYDIDGDVSAVVCIFIFLLTYIIYDFKTFYIFYHAFNYVLEYLTLYLIRRCLYIGNVQVIREDDED